MGFQTGLSGLSTASRNLDVIGNNVANASVVGFKQSSAQFADVFAASSSNNQVGIGAKVQSIAQQFNQGNITPTSNPLDFAIAGRGFFRLSDNGEIAYSRNGQFRLDNEGYIVNAEGLNLTGYGIDANGNIVNSSPEPLQFDTADLPPQETSRLDARVNLNSEETAIGGGVTFDPTNVSTYHYSTSATVFDSLGSSQVITMYFVKTAANAWDMYANATAAGTTTTVDLGNGAGAAVPLAFDSNGQLTTTMPLTATVTVSTGATDPLVFPFDLTGSTQFESASGINSLFQDGYTSGRLTGFNVTGDGTIKGRYNNGQSRNLGQVVLADFVNTQGLGPLGNNLWQETVASGLPLVGVPSSGTLGNLQSGAVEDSNVELTSELVAMIVAQRVYQANAQTIKTQDAVLQTLVNLR
ncbi:MAG: flagellar hook protein FlgE [Betaproteobacteria bacterium]|nr:flagellar hook protein FlgE [Betaproteobacteria bacterium]